MYFSTWYLKLKIYKMGVLSNILIGLVIIGITVMIHGYGTKFWINLIMKKYRPLSEQSFDRKAVQLLIYTALFLLFLNFLEAAIWGVTYYLLPGITEFDTLEKSIYFSLVTYTTLGYGEIVISSSNRILSGFEAMNGVLLLGWSTTMMFSVMQALMKNAFKENKDLN